MGVIYSTNILYCFTIVLWALLESFITSPNSVFLDSVYIIISKLIKKYQKNYSFTCTVLSVQPQPGTAYFSLLQTSIIVQTCKWATQLQWFDA